MEKLLNLIKNNPALALIGVGVSLMVIGAAGGFEKFSLRIEDRGWRVALQNSSAEETAQGARETGESAPPVAEMSRSQDWVQAFTEFSQACLTNRHATSFRSPVSPAPIDKSHFKLCRKAPD